MALERQPWIGRHNLQEVPVKLPSSDNLDLEGVPVRVHDCTMHMRRVSHVSKGGSVSMPCTGHEVAVVEAQERVHDCTKHTSRVAMVVLANMPCTAPAADIAGVRPEEQASVRARTKLGIRIEKAVQVRLLERGVGCAVAECLNACECDSHGLGVELARLLVSSKSVEVAQRADVSFLETVQAKATRGCLSMTAAASWTSRASSCRCLGATLTRLP